MEQVMTVYLKKKKKKNRKIKKVITGKKNVSLKYIL